MVLKIAVWFCTMCNCLFWLLNNLSIFALTVCKLFLFKTPNRALNADTIMLRMSHLILYCNSARSLSYSGCSLVTFWFVLSLNLTTYKSQFYNQLVVSSNIFLTFLTLSLNSRGLTIILILILPWYIKHLCSISNMMLVSFSGVRDICPWVTTWNRAIWS